MSMAPRSLNTATPATLIGAEAGRGGYRRLVVAPGEARTIRTDLGGARPQGALTSLLSFVQLSDLHVTDAQSPARVEFIDRVSDPGSPLLAIVGHVGTYRPQEALSAQVVEAMTAAVRAVVAPVGGQAPTFAVVTGDVTDNCQRNELDAYLALLDGGPVLPDSGDRTRWEGVGGAWGPYDPAYWHPDGPSAGEVLDRPMAHYGFPPVPGLLDAARRPWSAVGLQRPWYTVFGNHDGLLAGTVVARPFLQRLVQGDRKPVGSPQRADMAALLGPHETRPPDLVRGLAGAPTVGVTPDPMRRFVGRREWIAAHLASPGFPAGHGLSAAAGEPAVVYYAFEADPFLGVVLDTVNPHGGWQGSLDQEQLAWLEDRLAGAGATPVLIFSHHPIECLINDYAPQGPRRVLGPEVTTLLGSYPNVVAWFAGHTHMNTITPIIAPGARCGFWQVATASHVDWPQQSRLVEILLGGPGRQLVVATTPIDHAAPARPDADRIGDPIGLAAWSRELARNDYQERDLPVQAARRGGPGDRCTALVVPVAGKVLAGVY